MPSRSSIISASFASILSIVAVVVLSGCAAIGQTPSGERQARIEQSSQWDGDQFRDVMPRIDPNLWSVVFAYLTEENDNMEPKAELPIMERQAAELAQLPQDGLRITWFGHSTLLVEIDGYRVLIDPIWGERASPVSWAGPKRFHRPPMALQDLPKLDAVILSHDHYDHLDYPTILELAKSNVMFIMPLGVGSHLEYWGVAPDRIVELEWWESFALGKLKLVATPARHFSGRAMNRNQTLWAGWAFHSTEHRIWYSGDTAMFDGIREIGEKLGPFDVTIVEIGAYNQHWADVHMGPEQAVQAHRMARGKLMIPVHWGTFQLALHNWTAPIERVIAAAERCAVDVATPHIGESLVPGSGQTFARWWPQLPYRTATEYRVVSSGLEGPPENCAIS